MESKFHRPENYDKVRDLPGGRSLFAGGNDWESGWTWAGIHKRDGEKGHEPEKYKELSHDDCPGCRGTLNEAACYKHGKLQAAKWLKSLGLHVKLARITAPAGGAITNNVYQVGGQFMPRALGRIRTVMDAYLRKKRAATPVKLGRATDLEAGLQHAGVSPDTQKLSREQMAKVEDFYQVPEKKRISTKPKITKDALGRFFDHVSRTEIGAKDLRRVLRNPDHPDVMKDAILGLATRAAKLKEPSPFYTGDIGYLDKQLPHFLPHTHPTLAKLALAFTSSSLDPKDNLLTAFRMIRSGKGRMADIAPNNKPALDDWRARHPEAGEPPGDVVGRTIWADHHLRDEAPPYKSVPAVSYDHWPVGYYANGKFVEAYPGARKELGRGAEGRTFTSIPTPGQPMTPKGWSMRGNVLEPQIAKTKRILAHFGGDEERASEWLLSYHPASEVAEVAGIDSDKAEKLLGTHDKGAEIPGSFAFGPKIGSYHWNLHTDEGGRFGHQLTADLWWARLWNRIHGTLYKDKAAQEGDEGGAAAPRTDAERRRMWAAAKKAAEERGTTVSQLQADVWSTEQKLWSMFGLPTGEVTYRHGIDAAKKQKMSRNMKRVVKLASLFNAARAASQGHSQVRVYSGRTARLSDGSHMMVRTVVGPAGERHVVSHYDENGGGWHESPEDVHQHIAKLPAIDQRRVYAATPKLRRPVVSGTATTTTTPILTRPA